MHEILKHETFKYVYKMESKEYPADLNQLINIINSYGQLTTTSLRAVNNIINRAKNDPAIIEGFENIPTEIGPNYSDLTEPYRELLDKYVRLKISELTSQMIKKETVDVTSVLIDKINPKSISVALLYGEEDPVSGDWIEGISAKVFKECS